MNELESLQELYEKEIERSCYGLGMLQSTVDGSKYKSLIKTISGKNPSTWREAVEFLINYISKNKNSNYYNDFESLNFLNRKD